MWYFILPSERPLLLSQQEREKATSSIEDVVTLLHVILLTLAHVQKNNTAGYSTFTASGVALESDLVVTRYSLLCQSSCPL